MLSAKATVLTKAITSASKALGEDLNGWTFINFPHVNIASLRFINYAFLAISWARIVLANRAAGAPQINKAFRRVDLECGGRVVEIGAQHGARSAQQLAHMKIAQRDGRLIEMYLFVALVYFVMCFGLSLLVKELQKKVAIIR